LKVKTIYISDPRQIKNFLKRKQKKEFLNEKKQKAKTQLQKSQRRILENTQLFQAKKDVTQSSQPFLFRSHTNKQYFRVLSTRHKHKHQYEHNHSCSSLPQDPFNHTFLYTKSRDTQSSSTPTPTTYSSS
jgi:hypothetical protein